jgi:5,10-methylenetetrahydrofolate reductase
MAFLRVVEVFPPSFPVSAAKGERINTVERLQRFVEEARNIRNLADIVLVADVKDPGLLKISTIEAAAVLKKRLQVTAAPVIVVRDFNRPGFLSSILTAVALELKAMMIAWGDTYSASARASNVRDFQSLADAISLSSLILKRAHADVLILAPIDVESLARPEGVALAKGRLRAGADYLLAQPPTTDPGETFERHLSNLRASGLKDRVLLNVFPFRDEKDVKLCEKNFRWKLPRSLHSAAAAGGSSLLEVEKSVVRRLRDEGFPGVYLNTRGASRIAERLLS